MRRAGWWTMWVVLLCASGCSTEAQPDGGEAVGGSPSVIPDTVRQELVQLGTEDQAFRQGLTVARVQDTVFAKQMLRADSARTTRLRAIVEAYGWPDSVRAGAEASNAAFLILQHSADRAFQREMLPILEELALEGAVPRDEVAMLVDRVLVHDGLPQRYGTQFSLVDGRLVMDSVVDPTHLEERRRSMGLPTMEEYMRAMRELYQMEVVR